MRKMKPWQVLTLSATIMMLLLTVGTPSYASSGVRWSAIENAYIVPEVDGLDTLKLVESQAAEIAALRDILDEQNRQIARIQAAFDELETARLAEREAWSTQADEMERALRRQKSKKIAIGPFVGYDGHDEWTVGIGVTYKLFEM